MSAPQVAHTEALALRPWAGTHTGPQRGVGSTSQSASLPWETNCHSSVVPRSESAQVLPLYRGREGSRRLASTNSPPNPTQQGHAYCPPWPWNEGLMPPLQSSPSQQTRGAEPPLHTLHHGGACLWVIAVHLPPHGLLPMCAGGEHDSEAPGSSGCSTRGRVLGVAASAGGDTVAFKSAKWHFGSLGGTEAACDWNRKKAF